MSDTKNILATELVQALREHPHLATIMAEAIKENCANIQNIVLDHLNPFTEPSQDDLRPILASLHGKVSGLSQADQQRVAQISQTAKEAGISEEEVAVKVISSILNNSSQHPKLDAAGRSCF